LQQWSAQPSVHHGRDQRIHAIVTPGVRILTPFFNLYGTVTLVGGAAWSAWMFGRTRILLHRTIGNILVAIGAILPAFGGMVSRFGLPGVLYLYELLGAVLVFAGSIRATTPMRSRQAKATAQTSEDRAPVRP
jgi:hypothetical protein